MLFRARARILFYAGEGGPGAGLEGGIKLLRRAVDIGSVSVRADAAFELWLLTRRLPDSPGHGEALLKLACSSGHNPARFGMHRTSSRDREPEDFNVSVDLAATMCCLSDSLEANPTCPLTTSQCSNPGCGRWGVRARARLTGLVGPPGLPRCQGLHGGHCKTRYCSRFCQAIHWPEYVASHEPSDTEARTLLSPLLAAPQVKSSQIKSSQVRSNQVKAGRTRLSPLLAAPPAHPSLLSSAWFGFPTNNRHRKECSLPTTDAL